MAAGYSNKLVFIYTILHAEDSNKYFDNHKNYQQLSMTNKPNNFEENQVWLQRKHFLRCKSPESYKLFQSMATANMLYTIIFYETTSVLCQT